jgi:hypothetical protein
VEQGATALKTKSILDEEYFPLDRIRQGSLAATDLPDGQISDFPVQPPGEKYFAFRFGRNSNRASAVPPSPEGRFAIVTNVGCGMRWTRSRQRRMTLIRVRRSRVVLTSRR